MNNEPTPPCARLAYTFDTPYCNQCGQPAGAHRGPREVIHWPPVRDCVEQTPREARFIVAIAAMLDEFRQGAGPQALRDLEGYMGGPTLPELINGLYECANLWDRG